MNAFGVHGCSVVTAVTAQNTVGVVAVDCVSESVFSAQLDALQHDLPPVAIKTGMLGSAAICRILTEFLNAFQESAADHRKPFLVCDPVLQSSSGTPLLDQTALEILLEGIVPHTTLLTPNLPEAEVLLGEKIRSVEVAAEKLLARGARSVLIKGGHAAAEACRDYWTDGTQALWLSSPRIETRASHGTGCILSTAIASALALGQALPEAVISAKTYLNQCLRSPVNVGEGFGPMRICPFSDAPEDRPDIQ